MALVGNAGTKNDSGARNRSREFAFFAIGIVGGIALLLLVRNHPTGTLNGPGSHYASQGHCHIGVDCSDLRGFRYNSNPATSGPHTETFPANAVSAGPLAPATAVHMLEHGNVIVYYNPKLAPLTPAQLRQLSQPVAQNAVQTLTEGGRQTFVVQDPTLDSALVLTAWTRLERLRKFDARAVNEFVAAWAGNQLNSRQ